MFIKMRDHHNLLGRDSHSDMLRFLGLADSDPMMNPIEKIHSPGARGDHAHDAALQTALMPAGRLKSRYEVAIQASLAWFTMIQEKSIHASEAVVVKVLYDWNAKLKGQLINCRRHGWKDIVNEQEVEVSQLLILPKLPDSAPVGEGLKG
jgi:hypothetical protein